MVGVGLITKLTTLPIEVAMAVIYIHRYVSYSRHALCWTVVDRSSPLQSSAVHVTCLVFSLANEASHGVSPGLPLGDDPVVRPACTLVVRNILQQLQNELLYSHLTRAL